MESNLSERDLADGRAHNQCVLPNSPDSRLIHDNLRSSVNATRVKAPDPNQAGAVLMKIEDIFESISDSILKRDSQMEIQLKSRKKAGKTATDAAGVIQSLSNETFRSVKFPSKNLKEAWKFTALLRILELSHEALVSGNVVTKRDIYYRDPELFRKQAVVDRYVDDIAYTLGVERGALNVSAAAKGLICGSFTVTRNNGTTVDYGSDIEGILMPDTLEVASIQLEDVRWILVVEKEATFRTLSTSEYWKFSLAGRGIIMTANGYPDVQTRKFLQYLSKVNLSVCIYCLVDFDPDGLGILSTYKYGSVSLAHENAALAVPSVHWLGVRSSDILQNDGDEVGLLQLTARDRRIAIKMLEKETFGEGNVGNEWRRELQVMLMMNVKAEIQILSGGLQSLQTWLDGKLMSQ